MTESIVSQVAIKDQPDFIYGNDGHAGLSQRKAAELLKVSDVAILKLLKSANTLTPEETESIKIQGFRGANLIKLAKHFAKSRYTQSETKEHCIDFLEKSAIIGVQTFIDKMAGIPDQPLPQEKPPEPPKVEPETVKIDIDPTNPLYATMQLLRSAEQINAALMQNIVQTVQLEKRIQEQEAVVNEIKQIQTEAREALAALPPATQEAPEKSTRSSLNELVRSYVQQKGIPHVDVWRKLYRELRYRCHYDVNTRALNSGSSKLDQIERDGQLEALYAIALKILG